MGRIPRTRGRLIIYTGQKSWSAACGHGRYLEAYYGQVLTQGSRIGGEGGMWDTATVQGGGVRNVGGPSCDASIVGAAHPGVGL